VSPYAIDLIEKHRMKGHDVKVEGIPQDMMGAQKLADEPDKKEFEKWAICRIPGLVPNKKRGVDGGVDGRGLLLAQPSNYNSKLVLAQVKSGKHHVDYLRAFLNVIDSSEAAMGIYITLHTINSPSAHSAIAQKGSIKCGASTFPRAQTWSIQDYFEHDLPKMPPLADPYTGREMLPWLF